MANYTQGTLTGDLAPVNAELTKISVAIASQLDRDPAQAQANQLISTLDVNSQAVINLPAPVNLNDAARLQDVLAASQTGLPDQTGQAGKYLQTNGTAATWQNTPAEVYSGEFDQGGVSVFLPTGWSSVRNSTGNYSITISPVFADTEYSVCAQIISTTSFLAGTQIRNKTTSGFDIVVKNAAGAQSNEDVNFIVSKN